MSEVYQIDSDITKYADLCATVHNIYPLQEGFDTLLSYSASDSGFDGYAFVNDETKEVIITFSGSSDNKEDFKSVTEILSGHIPSAQFEDADYFYQKVIDSMSEGYSLSVTGFSLGGALAQLIGTKYGLETYTYNALGINSETMLSEASITDNQINYVEQSSLIKNYVVMNDPIGNTGDHIGTTYYISPILLSSDPIEAHRNIMDTDILENSGDYFELSDWEYENALALWKYDKLNNGEIPDNSNLLKTFNTAFTQYTEQESTTAFYEAINLLKNDMSLDNTYCFSLPDLTGDSIIGTVSLGSDNADIIDTEIGNDIIFAGEGNDILTANQGNDYLAGDAGNDSYLFYVENGIDFIHDAASDEDIYGINDTLKFGAGVTKNDIIIAKNGDDLIISFKNSLTDQITIYDQYDSGKIEYFMFDDNSIITWYDIDNYLSDASTCTTINEANVNTDLIDLIN